MTEAPRPGSVLLYPYLWHWQDERGETEGRKERPTVVVLIVPAKDGLRYALLLPLTTKEPDSAREAIEVPVTEKRRAGLDRARRQWILLDEYNLDPLQNSLYLRHEAIVGHFSDAFLRPLLLRFRTLLPSPRRVTRSG